MFCSNCGKEIANDSLFCINCGVKIESEKSNAIMGSAAMSNIPMNNTGTPNPWIPNPSIPNPSMHNPAIHNPGMYSTMNNPNIPLVDTVAKKKSRIWIPIVIGSASILLIVVIVFILKFNGAFDFMKNNQKNNQSELSNNKDIKPTELVKDGESNNDKSDEEKSNTEDSNQNGQTDVIYDYKYSYTELPDVVSLDSDSRFINVNYYSDDGVAIYSYLFYPNDTTDTEFYEACDDYGGLLLGVNGYAFEVDFSNQQFEETGDITNYYSKDDHVISVNASIENSLRYVYVTLLPLNWEIENDGLDETIDLPNYNSFLANRETKSFSYDETVNMENGLSFYVYEVILREPGDGTVWVDITMDLSSYYNDYFLNNGDFMIFPADEQGKILSDAIPITYVTDSLGYNVTMPFLTSASSYESYTFSYNVPLKMMSFTIYAANGVNNQFSGPVYTMEIGFN